MQDDDTDPVAGRDVVVVLSFRGAADTIACVESLVAGSSQACVLVIDNGSFDGVLEQVERRWPHVHTMQTGANLGFAGGMNRGIEWAMSAGAGTVTVLNNDTIVPPGAIARLAEIADAGVLLVSPVVLWAETPARVWFGGGVIDPLTGLSRHLGADELDRMRPAAGSRLRPSEVLAGCCLTASGQTWRRLGGFDEVFFLTFEDSELSLRAQALGVPAVVATDVSILHRVSASFTQEYSFLGLFYYTRNGLLFGSRLPQRSLARPWRFLRRHACTPVVAAFRDRQWKAARRRATVVAIALAMHLRGRYGPAPEWLTRLARRWAEQR